MDGRGAGASSRAPAARALLAGRLAHAEHLLERAAEAARDAGFRPSVVEFTRTGLLWHIRSAQGRESELRSLVDDVARTMPDRPPWWRIAETQLACERGDEEAARTALADAIETGLLQTPRGFAWGPTMIGAADAAAALDHRSLAAPLYELLKPHAETMVVQAGPLNRSAGRLALTLGHRDQAEAHLRAAVALCERMHARAYLSIARYDLGRLLLPAQRAPGCSNRRVRRPKNSTCRAGRPGHNPP